jgi:hypothetical protein
LDLLLVLQKFANNDGLVRHVTGDPIRVQEIDHVKQIGLEIVPHLIEAGTIKHRAAVAVVDVLLYEHRARRCDLPFELQHLAINGAVLLLNL